jgi:glycosyltransferase involved in cell wall biosynthesis
MRVAIVSPYDPRPPAASSDPLALRGGVEEALDRCARGLAARGHDVTMVTSAPRASEEVAEDGVRFLRVKRRGILFRTPLAPLAGAIPPDAELVHVPATYPLVSDLVPWRESRRGRATVLDYHFDPEGTSAAMRAAAWLHGRLLHPAMLRATRVVCKSLDYADRSRFLSRVPRPRLACVPNGVDLDAFPLGTRRGEDVLCVGRLVPYKGVDVLVRAMPRIHEETGARLRVVGDGPEAPRLRALARDLDAPVDFLGRVPQADLARLYGEARVSVLPSVNTQEAFGIALLESMATGTPVVASDLPGVREVASLAGLTAPPGDPQGLAEAVVRAWRDPDAFGAPADVRARVEARFAWPSVIERLEAVYEDALDAMARPGHPSRAPAPVRARRSLP